MCVFVHTGASAVVHASSRWGYGIDYGIYFSSVSCDGSEQNLLQCNYSSDYCSRFRPAGVVCYGKFF